MVNATGAFEKKAGVGTVDLVVIVVYFLHCLGVGIWATIRTKRSSVSGYFLAGREILWFGVGSSIFASDIGSGAMVGFAGTGAYSGIAVASYELNGLYCVLALGWFFVPVYIASGVYTMPEYLKKRFGGQRLQVYMSLLSLLLYVFTKISVDIYAGAIFIQQTVGWNMYLGIIVILSVTAIFTMSGGLRAVIYTDILQTVIMVGGAVVLMVISYVKIGGLGNLYKQFPEAIPSVLLNDTACGIPTDEAFHLLRNPITGDLPWPGNVLGITILGMWYFCSDQVLVQRSLAAKNMLHVKGGSILAGYLKLTPLFTVVFPGMISRVLFTDEIACVDPEVCKVVCGNPAGCTNIAYPKLVVELMPIGLKGLMLAAMMAALMSSLTSVFNSASTIFTMDFWHRIRKQATDRELLVIGRVLSGFIVGVIRMGLDFGYGSPGCGEEDFRPTVVSKIHFLHFTIILFLTSIMATVLFTLCTSPMDDKDLTRLTWWTRHMQEESQPVEKELTELTTENQSSQETAKDFNSESHDQMKDHVTHVPVSAWQRFMNVILGPESRIDTESSVNKMYHLTSIEEEPKWSSFVNFNAILLMLIAMFLWGYYR